MVLHTPLQRIITYVALPKKELEEAIAFSEELCLGDGQTVNIESGHLTFIQRFKDLDENNWGPAIGGYHYWGTATITSKVSKAGIIEYTMVFKFRVWDRYDWDPRRTGLQSNLARLHRAGLAHDYEIQGTATAVVKWTLGKKRKPCNKIPLKTFQNSTKKQCVILN